MDQDIVAMNGEYFTLLDNISKETERVMSENEDRELRSRIAVMASEIIDKSKSIEKVSKERTELD